MDLDCVRSGLNAHSPLPLTSALIKRRRNAGDVRLPRAVASRLLGRDGAEMRVMSRDASCDVCRTERDGWA